MKKILISLMTIAIVGALVGGGVFAYFSDVETSTGNIFTAGTLNLVPSTSGTGPSGKYTVTEGGDGVNGNVVFSKLAPGDSGTITWVLSNSGNLAGTLTIVSTITFSDVDANEPETAVTDPHSNNGGGNGDLDEFVGVKLERGVGTNQADAETKFGYIYGGSEYYEPFGGLEAILDAESQAMEASGGVNTIVYRLSWNIASDILGAGVDGKLGTVDDVLADDNIIQSDSATIDITFTLTQKPTLP